LSKYPKPWDQREDLREAVEIALYIRDTLGRAVWFYFDPLDCGYMGFGINGYRGSKNIALATAGFGSAAQAILNKAKAQPGDVDHIAKWPSRPLSSDGIPEYKEGDFE
jgi:hypothetical protein